LSDDPVPTAAFISDEEARVAQASGLGLGLVLSTAEVKALHRRIRDNYDLMGLTAKMLSIGRKYVAVDPINAERILAELQRVVSAYMADPSFVDNVEKQLREEHAARAEVDKVTKPREIAGVEIAEGDKVINVAFGRPSGVDPSS
jgi:hypothetical protein